MLVVVRCVVVVTVGALLVPSSLLMLLPWIVGCRTANGCIIQRTSSMAWIGATRRRRIGGTIGTSSSRLGDSPFDGNSDKSRREFVVDVISSPQSKTIKTLVGLLTKRKKRNELGETVVEGPRMIADLIQNPTTRQLVQQVVISEAKWDAYYEKLLLPAIGSSIEQDEEDLHGAQGFQVIRATPEVMDACTDTVTTQGIVARVRIPTAAVGTTTMPRNDPTRTNNDQSMSTSRTDPETSLSPSRHSLYLVLDGLQDPGNVGTLVRSSVATGVAGIFVLPPSADVWSPKAIRSAMGATFVVPIHSVSSFEDCLDYLQRVGCQHVYAATMLDALGDEDSVQRSPPPSPSVPHYEVDWTTTSTALVIGGEGNGLSGDVRRALVERPNLVHAVHVPMNAGIESLNAGVCGSVILFEYLRQQVVQATAATDTV